MSSYSAAHLDDIAAEKWPYWAPIRHHFDIRSFGINAWRGADGDEVIKRHDNGDEEILEKLPPLAYNLPSGVKIIRRRK